MARLIVATGVICLAAAVAGRAEAQGARAAERPADLSGSWGAGRGVAPDPALVAKLPPNTVVLRDAGAPELAAGDFGGLQPKAAARAAAAKWNPRDEMTISRVCLPQSIVYSMQGPFPMEIHQGAELMVIRLEYYDQVRVVFLDGRPHSPADAPHTKVGHSVGRWEGSTLVVDTTHISESTIANNGLDHSDNVHMVERYKLSADGTRLMATQWFHDPEVIENDGGRFIQWVKHEGQYINPYECDPTFALEYQHGQEAGD